MFIHNELSLSSLASAYTEPFPINPISAGQSADEDHGRTSEEEEGVGEPSFDRQVTNGERARGGKKSQCDGRVTPRELSIIIRAPLLIDLKSQRGIFSSI